MGIMATIGVPINIPGVEDVDPIARAEMPEFEEEAVKLFKVGTRMSS